jgi:hypothetical protein
MAGSDLQDKKHGERWRHEIYRHLGEWLLHRNESEIEKRYTEIGDRRDHRGVPLRELIWAIVP